MLTTQLINCKCIQVHKYSQGPNYIPQPLKHNMLLLLNVPFTILNHLLPEHCHESQSKWLLLRKQRSLNEADRAVRGNIIVFI